MAFDPVNGQLWDTENGPSSYDEINLVPRGFNSGWAQIMGPAAVSGGNPANLVSINANAVYSDPEFSFNEPIGITAIGFLAGSNLEAAGYFDGVIVGGSNGTNAGRLHLLRLNANRDGFVLSGGLADLVADGAAERDALLWGTGFGVVTDILTGPDGAVYVVSLSSGTIWRIDAIPEPGTWALMTVGAALVALGVRVGGVVPRRRLS